jgi:oligopeptide transport system substrate-binding protein
MILARLLAALCGSTLAAADWLAPLQPPDDAWRTTPQELTFVNEGEPETLDPALMTGMLEGRIALALFEGLCTLDPRTLAPRPGMAERWSISADGCGYVFHLREGLAWSDGAPLRAAEIVRSWLRVLDPATGSPYASNLYAVAGAADAHQGRGPATAVAVAAPDDRTLTVRLRAPTPWFLELTSFPTLAPVRMDVIERHGDRWTRAGHLIGNGPFALASWEPRVAITLTAQPHYRGAQAPRLTRITALPTDDMETAWRMYGEGAVDWLTAVPQARIDALLRHPDVGLAPVFGTYFYRFNCTRPPFDDARVRRAFSLAIDRAAITDHVTRGGEAPTRALVPEMLGYRPPDLPAEDREAPARLLAEAGYAVHGGPGRALGPVEILFNTSENHKAIAEAVAAQWSAACGVQVSARNAEWKIYLAAQDQLDYQVCRAAWYGDYLDPNTFLELWATGNGNNRTGWSDPAFDALLTASQSAADPVARLAMLQDLERRVVDEACPIAPIYHYVQKSVLRERVGGVWPNLRSHHPFQFVWVDP